jgi:hypothetical protein
MLIMRHPLRAPGFQKQRKDHEASSVACPDDTDTLYMPFQVCGGGWWCCGAGGASAGGPPGHARVQEQERGRAPLRESCLLMVMRMRMMMIMLMTTSIIGLPPCTIHRGGDD